MCKQNAAFLFASTDFGTSCLGRFSLFSPETCINLCIRRGHVLARHDRVQPRSTCIEQIDLRLEPRYLGRRFRAESGPVWLDRDILLVQLEMGLRRARTSDVLLDNQ